MVNSEAVAHTPQPHIGEAYVGITRYISTMYRGAVPITEHLPADVLEPLRGTEWRGASRPHKGTTLRSLRFSRSFVPLWGWGYAKPLRGFCYTDFCWRDGGILTPVDFLRAFDRLYSDSGLLTQLLGPSGYAEASLGSTSS